jgi:serine phosphatase RsbU (regulator of sigma subunit)
LLHVEPVVRRLLELAHDLEPDEVPVFVAREAAAAGVRDLEIFLADHRQTSLISATRDERHAVEGSLPGDSYRRDRAHVVDDEHGARVWLPLVDGEDRLGVMTVVVDDATEAVIQDLRVLAAASAGLLVSKRAYTDCYERTRRTEPMELAAEFRWALLPPLTMKTPRINIAGMLEPAYEIAGDAFDYAVNGDVAHVALFDAVGHGMTACRIANLAVASYRNSRREGRDLTDTAAAIDATLVDQFGESWFVTALIGELNLARGEFAWLSAGHPAPILVRGGRVIATLEAKPGMPLGLEGPMPEVASVQLEPDDSIFCYSDGVTEARSNNGEFFGDARLADCLARSASDGLIPAETVRRLVHRLYEHRPERLQDDATMLFVTWHRPAEDDLAR